MIKSESKQELFCIEPPPRNPTPEEYEEIYKFFISMGVPYDRIPSIENVRVGQGV